MLVPDAQVDISAQETVQLPSDYLRKLLSFTRSLEPGNSLALTAKSVDVQSALVRCD